MAFVHPTGKVPETVSLISLGPSKSEWVQDQTIHAPMYPTDEVWTLNTGMRWVKHDLCFVMDDMLEYAHHFPVYGELMKANDKPIITSAVYDEFPNTFAYPIEEILNKYKQFYFNNSVPYIIAYALHIGVKKLNLYGCDYTYPGMERREEGRGCVEYWIGFASAHGMDVGITEGSSLMDKYLGQSFYGYLRQPKVQFGSKVVEMRPENIHGATFEPPSDKATWR